jgi:hypothetical protein
MVAGHGLPHVPREGLCHRCLAVGDLKGLGRCRSGVVGVGAGGTDMRASRTPQSVSQSSTSGWGGGLEAASAPFHLPRSSA